METDKNGCSTTAKGQEQYEFFENARGYEMIQYDYRTPEGKLFSCVTYTLERARQRRDFWLEKQRAIQ